MSSPAAPSALPRILLGSLIGAVIGLILLALGLVILWKAAAPEGSTGEAADVALAPPAPAATARSEAKAVSPVSYPAVGPGEPPPALAPVEAPPKAATSIWRSIFDDGDDQGAAVAEAETAPSRAAPPAPAPRPAPRPPTPRRPPEAQRQDDSLFF